jgi:hypothetical protein
VVLVAVLVTQDKVQGLQLLVKETLVEMQLFLLLMKQAVAVAVLVVLVEMLLLQELREVLLVVMEGLVQHLAFQVLASHTLEVVAVEQ